MENKKYYSKIEIPWISKGESGTGNNVSYDDRNFPSGCLNRPSSFLFNNIEVVKERLESHINDPFLVGGVMGVGVSNNPKTSVILGSENSSTKTGLSFICSSNRSELDATYSAVFASDSTVLGGKYLFATSSYNLSVSDSNSLAFCASANSVVEKSDLSSVLSSDGITITNSKNIIVGSSTQVGVENCNNVSLLSAHNVKVSNKSNIVGSGVSENTNGNLSWSIDNVDGRFETKTGFITGAKCFAISFSYISEKPEKWSCVMLENGSVRRTFDEGQYIFGIVTTLDACNVIGSHGSQNSVLVAYQGMTMAKVAKGTKVGNYLCSSTSVGMLGISDKMTNVVSIKEILPYSKVTGFALHEVLIK